MSARPTALIADDEPLLREALARQLADAWPELEVVAQARNGREAIRLFEAKRADVCFLDVHMPGVSGIEAARAIGRRAHLVFVTAYDQYAVQFAQVHRSVVVNLRAVSHVTRGDHETANIHLKGRKETLPVSRSYLHLFRQM